MIRTFGAVTGLTNQPKGLDTGAGINTNDATVTAADVLNAKVAYGAGGARIVGTAVAGKTYQSGTVSIPANGSVVINTTMPTSIGVMVAEYAGLFAAFISNIISGASATTSPTEIQFASTLGANSATLINKNTTTAKNGSTWRAWET